MIYKRRRANVSVPGGFLQVEEESTGKRLHGFGYGDHIRLRDEFGTVWRGSAEVMHDDYVRYTFRDAKGRVLTGLADTYGVVLRDAKGKTWRGFLD